MFRQFNLMFSTEMVQWLMEPWKSPAPETAQGIFVNYPNKNRNRLRRKSFRHCPTGKAFPKRDRARQFIFHAWIRTDGNANFVRPGEKWSGLNSERIAGNKTKPRTWRPKYVSTTTISWLIAPMPLRILNLKCLSVSLARIPHRNDFDPQPWEILR